MNQNDVRQRQKGRCSLCQTLLLEGLSLFVDFVFIGTEQVNLIKSTLSCLTKPRKEAELTSSSSSAAAAGALAAEVEAVGVPYEV